MRRLVQFHLVSPVVTRQHCGYTLTAEVCSGRDYDQTNERRVSAAGGLVRRAPDYRRIVVQRPAVKLLSIVAVKRNDTWLTHGWSTICLHDRYTV